MINNFEAIALLILGVLVFGALYFVGLPSDCRMFDVADHIFWCGGIR
jgi:hypothetical protein